MKQFLLALCSNGESVPKPFSTFHIIFVVFVLAITVLLGIFSKKFGEHGYKTSFAVIWGIIAILEIGKQIAFSTELVNGVIEFHYQWFIFPFQFCSCVFYVLPFAFLLKDCKFRDWILSFVATFSLFAGVMVAIFFSDGVFCRMTYINHQTMLHHGSQIVAGVLAGLFLYRKYRGKKGHFKLLLGCMVIFIGLSAVAVLLNEVIDPLFIHGEGFNMFFISSHTSSSLAVIGPLWDILPWGVFLAVYVVGFAFVALVMYLLWLLCLSVYEKIAHKTVKA